MARVISIHQYHLKSGVSDRSFIDAVEAARSENLFELPGLESFHFLKGIKGEGRDRWTAIWVYKSRSSWEELWGPVSDPRPKELYPVQWQRWEDDLLGPLLTVDPDKIQFTSYEERLASKVAAEEENDG